MDLRPYLPSDRDACLAIFDSNAPQFPALGDRSEFERFLDQSGNRYFVMEHEGATIGCGGYQVAPEPGVASLVWGLVSRDQQRQGLGRFLLMYRLREIGKLNGIERVLADVPAATERFFASQGFKMAGSRGDRVEMVKKLTVCN